MLISTQMKNIRLKSGLTIKDLSKISKVSESAIINIENGKNTVLFSTLVKIVNSLGYKIVICKKDLILEEIKTAY